MQQDPYATREEKRKAVDAAVASFNERIPDEVSAWKRIFDVLHNGRAECRYCHSLNCERDEERTIRCIDCRRTTWLTAGTFFESAKLFRPTLLLIELWQRGLIISANEFSKRAGVAYATAHALYQKFSAVIADAKTKEAHVIRSIYCEDSIAKRSCDTPRRVHPITEEMILIEEEKAEERMDGEEVEMPDDSPETRAIYEMLGEKPVHFDSLISDEIDAGKLSAILILLEMAGLVRCHPGQFYSKVPPKAKALSGQKLVAEVQNLVGTFNWFIDDIFHRVSRKYLQSYAAFFWVHIDPGRWRDDRLLMACILYCKKEHCAPKVTRGATIWMPPLPGPPQLPCYQLLPKNS